MAAQYPRWLLKLQPHLFYGRTKNILFGKIEKVLSLKDLPSLLASDPKLPPFATTKALWKVYETSSEEKYNWQAFSVYLII